LTVWLTSFKTQVVQTIFAIKPPLFSFFHRRIKQYVSHHCYSPASASWCSPSCQYVSLHKIFSLRCSEESVLHISILSTKLKPQLSIDVPWEESESASHDHLNSLLQPVNSGGLVSSLKCLTFLSQVNTSTNILDIILLHFCFNKKKKKAFEFAD